MRYTGTDRQKGTVLQRHSSPFKPCSRSLWKFILNFRICEQVGIVIYANLLYQSGGDIWMALFFNLMKRQEPQLKFQCLLFLEIWRKIWIQKKTTQILVNLRTLIFLMLLESVEFYSLYSHKNLYLRNNYSNKLVNITGPASVKYKKWEKITY